MKRKKQILIIFALSAISLLIVVTRLWNIDQGLIATEQLYGNPDKVSTPYFRFTHAPDELNFSDMITNFYMFFSKQDDKLSFSVKYPLVFFPVAPMYYGVCASLSNKFRNHTFRHWKEGLYEGLIFGRIGNIFICVLSFFAMIWILFLLKEPEEGKHGKFYLSVFIAGFFFAFFPIGIINAKYLNYNILIAFLELLVFAIIINLIRNLFIKHEKGYFKSSLFLWTSCFFFVFIFAIATKPTVVSLVPVFFIGLFLYWRKENKDKNIFLFLKNKEFWIISGVLFSALIFFLVFFIFFQKAHPDFTKNLVILCRVMVGINRASFFEQTWKFFTGTLPSCLTWPLTLISLSSLFYLLLIRRKFISADFLISFWTILYMFQGCRHKLGHVPNRQYITSILLIIITARVFYLVSSNLKKTKYYLLNCILAIIVISLVFHAVLIKIYFNTPDPRLLCSEWLYANGRKTTTALLLAPYWENAYYLRQYASKQKKYYFWPSFPKAGVKLVGQGSFLDEFKKQIDSAKRPQKIDKTKVIEDFIKEKKTELFILNSHTLSRSRFKIPKQQMEAILARNGYKPIKQFNALATWPRWLQPFVKQSVYNSSAFSVEEITIYQKN